MFRYANGLFLVVLFLGGVSFCSYSSNNNAQPSENLKAVMSKIKELNIKKWEDFDKALASDDSSYIKPLCEEILSSSFPNIALNFNLGTFQRNAATNWCQLYKDGKVQPNVGKILLPSQATENKPLQRPMNPIKQPSKIDTSFLTQPKQPIKNMPPKTFGKVNTQFLQPKKEEEISQNKPINIGTSIGNVSKKKLAFNQTTELIVQEQKKEQQNQIVVNRLELDIKNMEQIREVVQENLSKTIEYLETEELPQLVQVKLFNIMSDFCTKDMAVIFDTEHFKKLKQENLEKFFSIVEATPLILENEKNERYVLKGKKVEFKTAKDVVEFLQACKALAIIIKSQTDMYYDNLTLTASLLREDLKYLSFKIFNPKDNENIKLGHEEYFEKFNKILPEEKMQNQWVITAGEDQLKLVEILLKQARENLERANQDFRTIDQLTREMMIIINGDTN